MSSNLLLWKCKQRVVLYVHITRISFMENRTYLLLFN